MSEPNSREVKSAERDDGTNCLSGQAMANVNSADSTPRSSVSSEK